MGRRIIPQRRGRGGPVWRATNNAKADVNYIPFNEKMLNGYFKAEVIGLETDPIRNGILANVVYEDGAKGFLTAAEGLKVGQQIQIGKTAGIEIGNIAILGNLPEGCPVFAVEKNPGDGGQYARSSGAYALIVTKDAGRVFLKLPSGKMFNASGSARATIGNSASGGRPDKPFVKAGKKYHHMRSKHKKYPKVRGVAMNPISHPFGGSQHHPGKSKSTSRHAAPGRKVGAIASKRTGRKKK